MIDKVIGATIACNVKVTFDNKTCEWIVEKEVIHDETDLNDPVAEWVEVYRFNGCC